MVVGYGAESLVSGVELCVERERLEEMIYWQRLGSHWIAGSAGGLVFTSAHNSV